MRLYRVCPVDLAARDGQPHDPSFVPRSTGQHRIDNAERYDTMYVSGSPAGAIAERFAWFDQWGDWLLEHHRGFDQRLITYQLDDTHKILDLDDAEALQTRGLRPSRVVTPNRSVTQAWAGAIHAEHRWAGVSWWSFHNTDWTSVGLWCTPGNSTIPHLMVADIENLNGDHPAVQQAATAMLRSWAP